MTKPSARFYYRDSIGSYILLILYVFSILYVYTKFVPKAWTNNMYFDKEDILTCHFYLGNTINKI